MRALLFDSELSFVTDYPKPTPGEAEALIRVSRVGICGTDLELTRGYVDFRGIPGHEFVGVVEEAPEVEWIGRRVVGEINCSCDECPACQRGDASHCMHRTTLGIRGRNGAMAKYCTLPLANLHPVPEVLHDDQAAFVEPLAAVLEILQQLHIRPTDEVIVLGDGRLGLLVVQVLALTGCGVTLVGRHEKKLRLADSGIEACLESDLSDDLQADVVVECTGSSDGLGLARRLVRPRGTLVLKSTLSGESRLDPTSLVVDEVTVVGSRCGPFAPALRLLERGMISTAQLVESIYPLEEGVEAFAHAARKGALKVLLRP